MASKQKTIRLAGEQGEWLADWTDRTGQPDSLVIRAALEVLRELLETRAFDDQVRIVAALGNKKESPGSAVAEELEEVLRRSAKRRLGKKSNRRSAS